MESSGYIWSTATPPAARCTCRLTEIQYGAGILSLSITVTVYGLVHCFDGTPCHNTPEME